MNVLGTSQNLVILTVAWLILIKYKFSELKIDVYVHVKADFVNLTIIQRPFFAEFVLPMILF